MPSHYLSRRQLLRAMSAGGILLGSGVLAACGAGSTATVANSAASSSTAPTASSGSATSSAASSAAAASSRAAPSTGSSTVSSAAVAPAGAPGSLSFWSMDSTTGQHYKAWVQRIDDFNKANPKSPAEMVNMSYADVNSKLPAVVAAGTPPNAAEQDRYTVPGGAAQSLMQDVAGRAKTAGISGDEQQPWAWQEVALQGKVYGLPTDTDSRMVFVNKTHLQQAGLALDAPKTLDDYAQVAQQLTKKQGESYQQIGFIPWYDNWGMYGWGWLFGALFYDASSGKATLTDPKLVAALEWLEQQGQKLGYQPVQDFIKARSAQGNLFTTQALSTYYQASASIRTYLNTQGLDWIAWNPPPPQGMAHTSSWSGGFCVVLPTGAKQPDSAFELMRYLSDAKAQLLMSQYGLSMPTIKAVAQDPYWNTVDPRVKQFLDILPFSHSRPPIKQINIMTKELGDARDAVLAGKKSAAQALQEANDHVNLAIQENRA